MNSIRKQALKMSVYLDQLLLKIQDARYGMYDLVEIPHLYDSSCLSLDDDLKTIEEAQQYIYENVSVQLYEELSADITQKLKRLSSLKDEVASVFSQIQIIFNKLKSEGFEQKLQDKLYQQLLIISNLYSCDWIRSEQEIS